MQDVAMKGKEVEELSEELVGVEGEKGQWQEDKYTCHHNSQYSIRTVFFTEVFNVLGIVESQEVVVFVYAMEFIDFGWD